MGAVTSFGLPTASATAPFNARATVNIAAGATATVLSFVVPASTTRNVESVRIVTDGEGRFSLKNGATEIAAGILDNVNRNVEFKFDSAEPISTGSTITLEFTRDDSPTATCPVSGFLSAFDN